MAIAMRSTCKICTLRCIQLPAKQQAAYCEDTCITLEYTYLSYHSLLFLFHSILFKFQFIDVLFSLSNSVLFIDIFSIPYLSFSSRREIFKRNHEMKQTLLF